QLMYWPTCCADGEYICRRYDGNWLSPDDFLSSHPHWKDCASLPVSPTEREAADRQRKAQEDPLSKSGIVGAFCRAYSVEDAMRKFLPDVYEETGDEGRWHYTPSDSIPGVVIYDGKFAYSHHASDPAYGKLLNAFDLVRIHRFGDDEPKKSFSAMSEFASRDEAVCALLLTEKRAAAARDFSGEDWTKGLQRDRNGVLANSLHNVKLILENDENLKGIVFNQLADGMEIKGGVPWKSSARFWRDADDAQLICYIDENYGTFSSRNYNIAVAKVTDDRAYHPILEFFASLPEWDGIPRADTLLVDYLGAEDSAYVRAVTRKTLCAAVARVWHPGVKFDNILVLNGAQGIGKSTLISLLGGDWYSDSLALTDMNDKTAAEKLQGYWILEIGELAGMKKADIDKVKAFISRQDDKYRASFGRRVTPHPRQCVFIGTTNSENGYLRDITGNRRFWTVKVNGQGKGSPWELSAEAIRQVWAEILIRTKAGEKLYLDAALEADARREQTSAMEQDDREGLVRAYLDLPLPDGWESMDLYRRRDYIHEPENPTNPVGTRERRIVCNMEIWCECFGKKKEDMRPCDSYAIAAIMTRLTGWEKNGICRLPLYGRQRVYKRL
ncbi:MAG: hypothetical protein IJ812_08710, partial [Schwartzia sp.]|nr:hypothetical protein [Schwartzia sp. (in: firmicutes)]